MATSVQKLRKIQNAFVFLCVFAADKIDAQEAQAMTKRGFVILMMLLVIALGNRSIAHAQSSTIAGVVKNASGEPVVGAFVKLRPTGSGPSFMVVSQAQGRYQTPSLLPGK